MPSQLPIRKDVDTFNGVAVVPISLGFDISGYSLSAALSRSFSKGIPGGGTQGGGSSSALSLSVTSQARGELLVTFPSGLRTPPENLEDMVFVSASWVLSSTRASAEDPATARRTLAVGFVTASSGANKSSPQYMEVSMVSGDEFTFTVDLDQDISSYSSIVAYAGYASIPASVISAASGLVRITIPEAVSAVASQSSVEEARTRWELVGVLPTGSTLLKGGPLIVSSVRPESGVAQSSAPSASETSAAPPAFVSLFL